MDYLMCGWKVRSDLSLPELAHWRGDARPPDLTICLGMVADPEQPIETTPFLSVGHDGQCRLAIDAVARFGVRQGREVVIEPHAGAAPAEIRTFLLGTVLGLVCHQRGLFPLHASCVLLGGGAAALAGPSGAGKSTLAALLARRGHPLLADDVCVIDPAAVGGPAVLPSFPRVKLWRDSLDALAIPADDLDRNRAGQEKYHYRPTGFMEAAAVPLRAIYLLEEAQPPRPEAIVPVQGFDAITAVAGQVYRRRAAQALGQEKALFQNAAAIAAGVPVGRLVRRKTFAGMDGGALLLEGAATP